LQVPSFEQSPPWASLAVQRPLGSAPPAATQPHVPIGLVAVPLQVLHRPASVHALSQHTPSVQKPLAHWTASVQAEPFAKRPHELFTHVAGGTQSLESTQPVLHAPIEQTYGLHGLATGVTQWPLPSQFEVSVTEVDEAHTAGPQATPAA
jgi:hypothetical protein